MRVLTVFALLLVSVTQAQIDPSVPGACDVCIECAQCAECSQCDACAACAPCAPCAGREDEEECEDCKPCASCNFCSECAQCDACSDCAPCMELSSANSDSDSTSDSTTDDLQETVDAKMGSGRFPQLFVMVGAFTCVAAMVATFNHRRSSDDPSKAGYSPVGQPQQAQTYGAVPTPSATHL